MSVRRGLTVYIPATVYVTSKLQLLCLGAFTAQIRAKLTGPHGLEGLRALCMTSPFSITISDLQNNVTGSAKSEIPFPGEDGGNYILELRMLKGEVH